MREVKEAYERIAEVFRESRGKPWTWVFDRLPNRVYDTILDAGCGNGANIRYAVSALRYRLYVACDVSYNMVKGVQGELGGIIDVVNCDIRLLPLRSSSVGLYLAIAVLHHLSKPDREAAYLEAVKVLRGGGLFVATVWGCGNGGGCDRRIKWAWRLKEPVYRFYHLFVKGELEHEVANHMAVKLSDEVWVGRRVNYIVLANAVSKDA
ncbi:MAG: class I SAM-dependent methyltransferase [Caldivirga sp.]